MSDKVISFSKERLSKMGKTGEPNFISCAKCQADTWGVGVMSDGTKPFIYAIVCISPQCFGNTCYTVENGILEEGAKL